jgi:hypothetical protein
MFWVTSNYTKSKNVSLYQAVVTVVKKLSENETEKNHQHKGLSYPDSPLHGDSPLQMMLLLHGMKKWSKKLK